MRYLDLLRRFGKFGFLYYVYESRSLCDCCFVGKRLSEFIFLYVRAALLLVCGFVQKCGMFACVYVNVYRGFYLEGKSRGDREMNIHVKR